MLSDVSQLQVMLWSLSNDHNNLQIYIDTYFTNIQLWSQVVEQLLVCSLWMSSLQRRMPISTSEGSCQRTFRADKIINNKISICLKSAPLLPHSYNKNELVQVWKLRLQVFCAVDMWNCWLTGWFNLKVIIMAFIFMWQKSSQGIYTW